MARLLIYFQVNFLKAIFDSQINKSNIYFEKQLSYMYIFCGFYKYEQKLKKMRGKLVPVWNFYQLEVHKGVITVNIIQLFLDCLYGGWR